MSSPTQRDLEARIDLARTALAYVQHSDAELQSQWALLREKELAFSVVAPLAKRGARARAEKATARAEAALRKWSASVVAARASAVAALEAAEAELREFRKGA